MPLHNRLWTHNLKTNDPVSMRCLPVSEAVAERALLPRILRYFAPLLCTEQLTLVPLKKINSRKRCVQGTAKNCRTVLSLASISETPGVYGTVSRHRSAAPLRSPPPLAPFPQGGPEGGNLGPRRQRRGRGQRRKPAALGVRGRARRKCVPGGTPSCQPPPSCAGGGGAALRCAARRSGGRAPPPRPPEPARSPPGARRPAAAAPCLPRAPSPPRPRSRRKWRIR